METWQAFISICAGIITVITVLEKLGILKKVKRVDNDFTELKRLPAQVEEIQKTITDLGSLQIDQNTALLAILRNMLYQSFKDNRDIEAWTDDEANVQTKLHVAYNTLNGNGEEAIWWDKKKTWKIVTNEEYSKLKNNCQ